MMEKCISIKKHLITYMAEHFSDYLYQGTSGSFYAFRKENDDGIYDHVIIQREFYEGKISLVITEVASCYNENWRGIPWFTVGRETDIGVLITGKNHYNADVGWHRCDNTVEALQGAFSGIKRDMETYVFSYFAKNHEKILSDKCMTITNQYMHQQMGDLTEAEVASIKEYLVDVNKAYSKYQRECKKSGQKETLDYYEVIPLHQTIEKWLAEIGSLLNYFELSQAKKLQIIRYAAILFRDRFDFYNLR